MPRKKPAQTTVTGNSLDLDRLKDLAALVGEYSLEEENEPRATAFFQLSRGVPAMMKRIRELELLLAQSEAKLAAAPAASPKVVAPSKKDDKTLAAAAG